LHHPVAKRQSVVAGCATAPLCPRGGQLSVHRDLIVPGLFDVVLERLKERLGSKRRPCPEPTATEHKTPNVVDGRWPDSTLAEDEIVGAPARRACSQRIPYPDGIRVGVDDLFASG